MALVLALMALKTQGSIRMFPAEADVRVAEVPDIFLNEMQSQWLQGWWGTGKGVGGVCGGVGRRI